MQRFCVLCLICLGAVPSLRAEPVTDARVERKSATDPEALLRAEGDLRRDTGRFIESWSTGYLRFQEAEAQRLRNLQNFAKATESTRQRDTLRSLENRIEAIPPRRLPSTRLSRNGGIVWPKVLSDKRYQANREKIAEYFARRAQASALDRQQCEEIHEACGEFAAELDRRVLELPSRTYLEGARFLRNLAYEAQFPVGSTKITSAAK